MSVFPYPSRTGDPVELAGDVSDALSGARRACTDVLWALAETGLYVTGIRLDMVERFGCAYVLAHIDITARPTTGEPGAGLPDGDDVAGLLYRVGLVLAPHSVGARTAQRGGCSCTWTVDPRDPWAPAQVTLTARLARCPSTAHTHHDNTTDTRDDAETDTTARLDQSCTCDPRGGDR